MKPILFNTEMVQAILDGRKTVTRRAFEFKMRGGRNPNFSGYSLGEYCTGRIESGAVLYSRRGDGGWEQVTDPVKPRYLPGDILWVRETWQAVYETEYDEEAPGHCVNIRTLISNFDTIPKVEAGICSEEACRSMEARMKYYVFKESNIEYADPGNSLIWKPSIHMPREAARIFLRVTDVRVERLQEITGYQARREGMNPSEFAQDSQKVGDAKCIRAFTSVWDSTIKPTEREKYGWNANPWVWVIEFERCEMPEDYGNDD